MERYKYIFVVLVYRNTDVLAGFYKALSEKCNSYKVIIVDSFYSDEVREKCKNIAREHQSDFVAIENKGYGYGNNVGIEYASAHYDYDFLIVSNSDIEIQNFGDLDDYQGLECIVAPEVFLVNNKKQNPNIVWYSRLYYFLLRVGYKSSIKLLVWCGFFCSRIMRELFLLYSKLVRKERYRVFSAHGSCFIMTKRAVNRLSPIFNIDMFLYNEELYLALKARCEHVPVYFDKSVRVLHLEGASAGSDFSDFQSTVSSYNQQFPRYKESFMILDKWKRANDL